MRILFLSTWFPKPLDNGSKIRVYYLLKALASRHEVTLISFAFGKAKAFQAGALEDICEGFEAISIDPFNYNQKSPLRRFLSPKPVSNHPVPQMSRLVDETLSKRSFDLIIGSTGVMAGYALQASESAPIILEEHNSLTRWMRERYELGSGPIQRARRWLSWQKTRRYENWLFNQFDLVTMVSEEDRDAVRSMLPDFEGLVEIIPNGVDCEYNSGAWGERKANSLIFTGALGYYVNYKAMYYFLSEIYPLIKQELPGIRLLITGSLDGVDLTGLPIDKSVELSGFVDDVRPFVAAASVCVVPILEGGGSRLKILEAMALGTPVVSTRKGAEGLKVLDGNNILLADEPDEFARFAVTLLQDKARSTQIAQSARRLVVEKYDWTMIGNRFLKLVEEVVSSG